MDVVLNLLEIQSVMKILTKTDENIAKAAGEAISRVHHTSLPIVPSRLIPSCPIPSHLIAPIPPVRCGAASLHPTTSSSYACPHPIVPSHPTPSRPSRPIPSRPSHPITSVPSHPIASVPSHPFRSTPSRPSHPITSVPSRSVPPHHIRPVTPHPTLCVRPVLSNHIRPSRSHPIPSRHVPSRSSHPSRSVPSHPVTSRAVHHIRRIASRPSRRVPSRAARRPEVVGFRCRPPAETALAAERALSVPPRGWNGKQGRRLPRGSGETRRVESVSGERELSGAGGAKYSMAMSGCSRVYFCPPRTNDSVLTAPVVTSGLTTP